MSRRDYGSLPGTTKTYGLLLTRDPEPVVLGIDASLTSPAISFLGTKTQHHHTSVYKTKHKGSARLQELYDYLFIYITEVMRAGFEVKQPIVIEGYSFGSKSRGHAIGEGGGAIRLALWDILDAEPLEVAPSQLKKFVLGKGNGDKNQILKRVFQKWGADFSSDDAADAFALAKIAHAVASGQTDHAYEQEVLDKLQAS